MTIISSKKEAAARAPVRSVRHRVLRTSSPLPLGGLLFILSQQTGCEGWQGLERFFFNPHLNWTVRLMIATDMKSPRPCSFSPQYRSKPSSASA